MVAPEFIYLNEQAVRVSGWQRDEATGAVDLVVVVRGSTDRDTVLDSLSGEPVMIRIGSASAVPMEVRALDTKSSGSDDQAVHRIKASLWPEGSPVMSDAPKEPAPEERIEAKLDEIIRLLTEIRNENRHRA